MPELMKHQKDALQHMHNGCVLWGGVGTGKSMTAMAYYAENECPRDIVVITTAKKRDSLDWLKEAARFGISTDPEGTTGGTILVESWNNINKFTDFEDYFFIFDEQRVVGNGTWVKAFLKIAKKNHWILLSGTPGDTWSDYIPVFIANGFYKNKTQFGREHIVLEPYSKYPKIRHYLNVPKLEFLRNEVLVEMPYVRHTERHLNYLETEYDPELWETVYKKRWNPWEDEPIKDVAELFRCMRRVANDHPSKIATVQQLLRTHDRLVIFYNFNYELDALRTLHHDVPVAEWNGHKKEPIPDSKKWVYLVQYVAGAEGWNCTETNAMVFYSLTYSYKNFEQAQGRIDRLDTPYTDLYYYILASNLIIDKGIREALREKKSFNEKKFASGMEDMDTYNGISDSPWTLPARYDAPEN